jgi:AcrR family transcriptional regulator
MPKVTQEYIDNKKRMIVEACMRVCKRKPVEMVTMTDVIEETGLSQGGIYRFYKDLDEILRDMILEMRIRYNIMDDTDKIIEDSSNDDPATTIRKMCSIMCSVVRSMVQMARSLKAYM